jgi:hypothetical protein
MAAPFLIVFLFLQIDDIYVLRAAFENFTPVDWLFLTTIPNW